MWCEVCPQACRPVFACVPRGRTEGRETGPACGLGVIVLLRCRSDGQQQPIPRASCPLSLHARRAGGFWRDRQLCSFCAPTEERVLIFLRTSAAPWGAAVTSPIS